MNRFHATLLFTLTMATTGCTTCGDHPQSSATDDSAAAPLTVAPGSSVDNPQLRRLQQRKDISRAIADAGTDPSAP
jgi:hypothetical protein